MQFKTGVVPFMVDDRTVAPELWDALRTADHIHQTLFQTDITVTSLRDGTHNPGSYHPLGYAADIRVIDEADPEARVQFYTQLREALGDDFYHVVWEGGVGATPATTGAHVHIQYQFKQHPSSMPPINA